MDPEIQKALAAGYFPAEIAAELQRRGLAVPPALLSAPTAQMPVPSVDATRTPLSDRVASAAVPTLGLAGVVGAGVGAVKGAQAAARGVVRSYARKQITDAVGESGGLPAVLDRLHQFDQAGRGQMVTLGDLTPRLAAEADYVATNRPAARAALAQLHNQRQRGVPDRLLGDVEQLAPGGYSAPQYLQDLSKRSQQLFGDSDQGYRGLREANPVIDPAHAGRLGTFLESPQLTRAWQDAAAVGAVGPLPPADQMSFETLQNLKERLDGLGDAAWRQGNGDLGRRLGAARDQLVNILTDAVPNYAQVNATYARFANHQRALQSGLETWDNHKIQLPDLERQIQDMTPEQLTAFRQGVVGGYIRDIENAKTNRNLANTLLARSATTERKLELIFGTPEAFQQAVQRLQLEGDMSRLGQVVGQSITAVRTGRQAAAADAIEGATDAGHVILNPVTGVPAVARKRFAKWAPSAVADRMAPYFTTQGSEALREFLRMLRP